MTALIRIIFAAFVALFFQSCGFDISIGDFTTGVKGNGQVISENRAVKENFNKVSAEEGLEIYLSQADSFSIRVEAHQNVIPLIATEIKNGKLRIHSLENIGKATKKIYVSLPKLSNLYGSSGALIVGETSIATGRLSISGNSGANINLDITANTLEVETSSGAILKLSGSAEQLIMAASSGGNINAKEVKSKICDAKASSGGQLNVYVTDKLLANATSGGSISYTGTAVLQEQKSVSGSVRKY